MFQKVHKVGSHAEAWPTLATRPAVEDPGRGRVSGDGTEDWASWARPAL